MKRFFSAVLLAVVLSAAAATPALGQDLPFDGNEKLALTIHYKWGMINADIARADYTCKDVVINGEKGYHVYTSGNTFKFWDSFFKVRDVFEAKVAADDCSPRYFHRSVEEGNYRASNVYNYDDVSKKVAIKVTKGSDYKLDSTLYTGSQIYDVISLILRVRAIDFDKIVSGTPVTITMAMDRNMLDVRFHFVKRERKKIDEIGTFNAVEIAASVTTRKDHFKSEASGSQFDAVSNADKVFSGKDDIFIWFSDDKNRVPLAFKTPISVGSINGKLTSYSGLKYPLTSKVVE